MKKNIILLILIFQTMIMAETKEGYEQIRHESEMLHNTITKCKQKNAEDCREVGLFYNKAEEYNLAFHYFQKACDENDSVGCGFVGIYKFVGKTTQKDKIGPGTIEINRLEGLQYLDKSCKQGYNTACEIQKKAQNELRNIWLDHIKNQNVKIICDGGKDKKYELDKKTAWVMLNSPIIETYENFFESNCNTIKK